MDEMEFEILENAQPGDFISLKEILDAGSKEITRYISEASNVISRAKEEEIYNKAKEHFSKNVIESKEYNDLIIKFESEKNELLREYQSSLKEELEKNRKSLSAKFTTDLDEALKKEKELIAFQKNIEFLELQNKIKSQSELLSHKEKEFNDKISLLVKEKEIEILSLRKDLEDKINVLNADSSHKDEKIKFLEEEKSNKDNIINEKVAEINKLSGQLIEARTKSSWKNNNIKTIGNEFEDHLLNMLEDAFSMDTNIRFSKGNTSNKW
ncbi:hypothetical protein ONA24_02665 [Mycoplasmopsis cynos]|uniref:hypothetical protein n=1 Tax=Mycoplasmopsis cynos TaxID=171284 RepID=UPI0024CAF27D|nr:hypothetical protein [Mycoplasmopsis cynos]WAM10164.1 hypothetical protein ONA24_02665 [Mycoplasmopsis cynos]